jgi:hypothetical protein
MAWTFPDNFIDINSLITKDNAWHDVDVSSVVPAGSKAAILCVEVWGSYAIRLALFRPKGSTDDRGFLYSDRNYRYFVYVKLDSSRLFQAKIQDSNVNVWLAAYTDDDHGFTQSVDKSTGTTGSYEDVDVSADVPEDAIAVFAEVASSANYQCAFRKKGASDDYYNERYRGPYGWFIGLDSNKKLQQKIENAGVDLYIWGSICSDGGFLDTYVDKAPATLGSWQDVDLSSDVPANAVGAVFLAVNNHASHLAICALRKKGSTDDVTQATNITYGPGHIIYFVGLDENKKCQAYLDPTYGPVNLLLIGWLSSGALAGGYRNFPLPNSERTLQSQAGKRTFPLPADYR